MSEVNVPVTETAPVVVQGGDSAIMFDDLTSAFNKPTVKAEKAEKTETKETKEEKEAAKPEKDLTDDTKKAKFEEKGKKEDKPKVDKAAEKEAEIQRKIHKAKLGETELDIDDEAEITVKVNGKEERVKLNELLSNYSGKTNWSKQFQDLSQTRKEVDDYVGKLTKKEESIKAVFEEKDPQIRMYKMAEMAGVSPIDFRQKFLDENINLLEKYMNMSDDERKADALSYENSYLKHQADTRQKMEAKSQADKQLQAEMQQVLASHNLKPDEFSAQEKFLKGLASEGKLDATQITPKFVAETKVKDNLWISAATALQASQSEIPQEKMIEMIDSAFSMGLKPEDMPEIVDELFGKKAAKQVIEEKKQQAKEFKEGKQPQIRTQTNNDVWSFDQI